MSRKIIFALVLSIILSACAPTPTQTSEVSETSEVSPATATSAPSSTPEPLQPTETATPETVFTNPTRLAEQKLTIPGTDGVTLDAADQATWDSAPADAAEKVTDKPTVKVWSEMMNQVLYVDKNGEVVAAYDAESGQLLHALLSGKTLWTNEGNTPLVFNPDYPAGKDPQEIAGMVGDYFLWEMLARTRGVELGNVLENAIAKALDAFPNGSTARLKAEKYNFTAPELQQFNYNVSAQTLQIDADTPLEVRLVTEPTSNMLFAAGVIDGEIKVDGVSIDQDESGKVIVSFYYKDDYELRTMMAFAFEKLLYRAGYGEDVPIVMNVAARGQKSNMALIVFE